MRTWLAALLTVTSIACDGAPKGGHTDTGTPPETGGSDSHSDQSDTDTDDTDTGGDSEDTDTSPDTSDTAPCTPIIWYADGDDDGYGDPSAPSAASCEPPDGTVSDDTDCDDTNPHRYPGAEELCRDGVVNDCSAADDTDAIAFCSSTGPFSLEGAGAKLVGEMADDHAGYRLRGGWDLNGDGLDDLLILAYGATETGRLTVVLSPVAGTLELSDAEAQIQGEEASDRFGSGLAGAGDVDGDGFSDIAIGADWADRAYLFLSPVSGELSAGEADTLLYSDEGGSPGPAFGSDVVGPGDVDGDGLDDLLVGAPTAQGLEVESEAGECATEASWADEGPGVWAGVAYLYTDPAAGPIEASEAEARLLGEDAGDGAGAVLARVGDMNGDGLADMALVAQGNCEGGENTGAIYVVLGPVSGDLYLADAEGKIRGTATASAFDTTLSGAGDVSGDGSPDLISADEQYESSTGETSVGAVYLFLGPVSGTVSVWTMEATLSGEEYSHAGNSIAAAGDVDADGFADIVVGAYLDDRGGENAGAAYLVYGPLSGTISLEDEGHAFVGSTNGRAGKSVAGVGDTDADGLPDILVGATGDDTYGDYTGAAYLLLGGGALLSGDGEI